ncbi:unnamed protein product [Owenia fusiformis]|uniref:Uncharacterized protein n=1 Tax=Owenia fusiformis TaxID=6347 RepID=A0A8J1XQS3_OWEFU|nr:unnamed protein product [Owenia fusiformis]
MNFPKECKDFNYEAMEDELTCPVCLELYADPLMLPCSHSVCKSCLTDIFNSKEDKTKGLQCPACRKQHRVTKGTIPQLPRNLALENIVIRYTEEISKHISKTLNKSLSFKSESPPSKSESPEPRDTDKATGGPSHSHEGFPSAQNSKRKCDLCESSNQAKATQYCCQCDVNYCNPCLNKYHPRRGALLRHKLRAPFDVEKNQNVEYCEDHTTEHASIYCDHCKLLICHLCVCDGDGKHGGHKILKPENASRKMKESIEGTKLKLENLLTALSDQCSKAEDIQAEMKATHINARTKIEAQCKQIIQDNVSALTLERDKLLHNLSAMETQHLKQIHVYIKDNQEVKQKLQTLAESCQTLLDEKSTIASLQNAHQMDPLMKNVVTTAESSKDVAAQYQSLLRAKQNSLELKHCLDDFRTIAKDTLNYLLEDTDSQCPVIVPCVNSPSTSGKTPVSPRFQSKCLTTWGFTSTTFTADPVQDDASWTIAVERNNTQIGDFGHGYLFGVGITSEELTVKDQVGVATKSYGILCLGGMLIVSSNGKHESVMALPQLPLNITLTVLHNQPKHDHITMSYRVSSQEWGNEVSGRKIIHSPELCAKTIPAFTVSQRVKMLFPYIFSEDTPTEDVNDRASSPEIEPTKDKTTIESPLKVPSPLKSPTKQSQSPLKQGQSPLKSSLKGEQSPLKSPLKDEKSPLKSQQNCLAQLPIKSDMKKTVIPSSNKLQKKTEPPSKLPCNSSQNEVKVSENVINNVSKSNTTVKTLPCQIPAESAPQNKDGDKSSSNNIKSSSNPPQTPPSVKSSSPKAEIPELHIVEETDIDELVEANGDKTPEKAIAPTSIDNYTIVVDGNDSSDADDDDSSDDNNLTLPEIPHIQALQESAL